MAKTPNPTNPGSFDTIPPESKDLTPRKLPDPDIGDAAPDPEHSTPEPDPIPRDAPRDAPAASPAPVASDPAPVERAEPRRGGLVPLVLGGVIAGAIGYGIAWWQGNQRDLPDPEAQAARMAEIEDRIGSLEDTAEVLAEGPDLSPLQDAVDTVSADTTALAGRVEAAQSETGDALATIESRLTELDDRLTNVEQRPEADGSLSSEAVEAYEREIAALRAETSEAVEALTERMGDAESRVQTLADDVQARLDSLEAEAEALEQSSEQATARAGAQAALASVRAAVESGAPFAEALEELRSYDVVEVPAVLSDNAESGVASLAALRESYPEAARAALGASRSEESGGGVGGFFERQFNLRSVEPREGDDPDAILSRAEAALSEGRLADALSELEALPETSAAAMSDWLTAARMREEAVSAAATMTQSLTTN